MVKIDTILICPRCGQDGVFVKKSCEKNCDTIKCLVCQTICYLRSGRIFLGHDSNCYRKLSPI